MRRVGAGSGADVGDAEKKGEFVGFCTVCDFQIASYEGLTACPNCGTIGTPCGYDDDVTVRINRHELAILTFWAERWGMAMLERGEGGAHAVYAIVSRLRRQNPGVFDGWSLTFADETDALRRAGIEFRTNLPGIEDHGGAGEGGGAP